MSPDARDVPDLRGLIRTIPDHPSPGIMFRDITTLLLDGDATRYAIDRLAALAVDVDAIAGVDARGFLFASPLAVRLGVGQVLLRKSGKLPGDTLSVDYDLEYGTDQLHLHVGAVTAGQRVVLVDDLIATGGTAAAGVELLRSAGAIVDRALFVVDLPDLGGADRLRDLGVTPHALVAFDGE